MLRLLSEMKKLANLLRLEGAEVISIPIMKIEILKEEENKLMESLQKREKKVIIFTSALSVERFIEIIQKNSYDKKSLERFDFVSSGEGTTETLRQHHLKVKYQPPKSNRSAQEKIWEIIEKYQLNHFLFPRAREVNDYLENRLDENGLDYETFKLYALAPKNQVPQVERIAELIAGLDYLLFTSSKAAEYLFSIDNIDKVKKWPRTLSIGKPTFSTLLSRLEGHPKLKKLVTENEICQDATFAGMLAHLIRNI